MHEKSPTGVGKIFAPAEEEFTHFRSVFCLFSVRKIENRFKHDAVDFRNGFFLPPPRNNINNNNRISCDFVCVSVCVGIFVFVFVCRVQVKKGRKNNNH